MNKPLILVVEDEPAIRELVAFVCEAEGFRTVRAGDVGQARRALAEERPALVLLDRMLPGRSGLSWLQELRAGAATAGVPVILLTARGGEADRVEGLDAGADDYVVKPFLPRELAARIRAVLRRSEDASARVLRTERQEEERIVTCGPLVMNETRHEATAAGVVLKLSAKEFALLQLLASRPGRVYSRASLLDAVWPGTFVDERTVDVHMLRLRKALAGTAARDLVETVRGVGYRCRDVGPAALKKEEP